jgi:peptidoglycan-associated lipoprotein
MAVSGCKSGGGRKPALQDGSVPTGATASSGRPSSTLPADSGPDVGRLDSDGAYGSDLGSMPPADMSTEGGPLADIRFDLDSAALSEEARSILAGHAGWLKTNSRSVVTVEGHCDERGTTDYNLALGEQRAQAAREYLIGLGISGDRLRAVSFGKEKPVDPASTEEAWARNRRAHFVVAGRS